MPDISSPRPSQLKSHPARKPHWRWAAVLWAACTLTACGGGDADNPLGTEAANTADEVPFAARALAVSSSFNQGVADPGLLMLLLPDGQSLSDDRVTSWLDAASEVGTRMAVVTDTQFLAMGPTGALRYAGLVLPDQLHFIATDDVVAAVRDYTTQGGRTFLTFDFAALTLNSAQQPVYPIDRKSVV